MSVDAALNYIHSLKRFGKKPGLAQIKKLLERLGNPQKKLRFVHVAGTNGKGSTCAYISSILSCAGYKTGLFISPFVNMFNERIQVNGKNIPDDDLVKFTLIVKEAAEGCVLNEFEFITAVGMMYFAHMQCDYVVLEVGLGGRYDATNVIDIPEAAVIASIGIDHTEILGDTIEKIAFEKCGIIKPGGNVIAYCDNVPSVNEVIRTVAEKNEAVLTICGKEKIRILSQKPCKTVFEYDGGMYETGMCGVHQVYNAVSAIETAKLLNIDESFIKTGLSSAHFYGRFQLVSENPRVIIDGAHNFSGAAALKNALLTYFPNDEITVVMGMLKDKEYEKCVAQIAPLAKKFIATEPDSVRKVPASVLAETARAYNSNVIAVENRDEAIKTAVCNKNSTVCICGSLYLIGNIGTIATCKM